MSASVEIPVANSESAPAENLLDYEERFLDKDRKFLKRYMMKPPMGYALLLGCKQYDDTDQPLLCVDKDLNSMTKVLNEIGIEEANSGSRTTKEDYERMKHSLLSKKDLNKYSCFMLYYSGHGSPDGLLLYPNHEVPFKHVLEMVQGIPALHGKPKILIFDCCRGNDDCNTAGLDFMESSTFGDMIVCFACTHNAVSINVVLDGSVFTQHFVVALREFRHETSFVDLLDQAKGNTFQVVRSLFDRRQQAVSYNYLNAQLMFRETKLSDDDQGKVKLVKTSSLFLQGESVESPFVLAHVEERKGCFKPVQSASPPTLQSSPTYTSQELPMDLSLQNEVMKDYVPALTTSKEDIMDKVHLLGRGHQVFICYLPDPGSPYGSPDPKRSASNERAVTLLHYDLIRHGFAVFSDLSLGDQHPLNLLQWYISHIERCHHVILVCSAAFKELFTTLRPSGEVKDPRACRFLSYSPAIYAELERTMNRRKFLPVLLEPEWANSVPCVFQASFVYELYEMDQRTFDYNNKERHFEKLVCQMVGINRVELDAPKPEAPVIISHSSSSSDDVLRRKFSAYAARSQQPGRTTIPFSDSLAWTTASQPSSHTAIPFSESQAWASASQSGPHTAVPFSESQAQDNASIKVPHQPHSQIPPTVASASEHPATPDIAGLPLTPPSISVFLWLSSHLVRWKFFARHLGLGEHDIDRIELDNPKDIQEQCYQMLRTFGQQQPQSCTYRRIGEALWESEKNRHLFFEYCTKVSEQ